ncbi:TetR/AcrR family transcriptional regulator [Hyphomonas oceanitis]|uniref:TetR family transcriptional regulator n=1 Tax=Hyphomonas oceanitis SCH89 TaxID=1280953 RepID=A0A059GBY8_9PROT|nr:TetR/AcrR family transcriptional regulator [Hyphomonas oceanitis]KDA03983.1 TetR family transcriptional regulator [Hyphomonas oceanitis SCH89]
MTEKTRRNPKQARAQATVDAILEATLHILETEGLSKLTTNHIAERAGVSIGTLYQYFSDRDAILASLGKRQSDGIGERIHEIMHDPSEPDGIRKVVRALMHGVQGSAETRIVLSDALFRVHGEAAIIDHSKAFSDIMQSHPELSFINRPESAFILTHAVVCLLRAAIAEPGLGLQSASLEDELVLLMESYLMALAVRAQNQPKE